MMTSTHTTHATLWLEANQRYLMAALGQVRAALERHMAGPEGHLSAEEASHMADSTLQALAETMMAPAALEVICAAFALSSFERAVLLLCAGVELDSSFAACCAAAQGDPKRTSPTFGLALATLPAAHWSALTPAASLRRWRLIEVGAGETLTASPLRIDETILHTLAGAPVLDERLQPYVRSLPMGGDLPPSQHALARRIASVWSRGEGADWPIIQLCGSDEAGRRSIAASSCTLLTIPARSMRAADLPGGVAEREALGRLWEREAILSGSALVLECDERDSPESLRSALAFIESLHGPLLMTCREPLALRQRPSIRLEVHKPRAEEQQMLWRRMLGPAAERLNGQVEAVVCQFNLGMQSIQAVCAETAEQLHQEDSPGAVLWDACRAQARARLEGLAQRIMPAAAWNDLVLPDAQRRTLHEIAAHVRQRARVYQAWGFAARSARGLGISALFAGASGTGKTMAAEVLANELQLDLYHIDLSQVVSKYIGETEKNLRRIFDAAEEGGAILLFDEADALFGKRSEVKDSHDRYANIEVSYLLQRMEAYQGLAILTTNLQSALDTAFLRRLRFIVQFPFPDAGQRAQIWQHVFPASTPTAGLEIPKLARLNLAGGNIRNIALHAAFLAADEGDIVQMKHLLRAARSEYAKLERALTEAEIGGWV
ncbi:MAG TPA: ATP-binding protein [Ktedonobacterales bacterium]|jgi:hypothetical protein